jgi:hypothetical protein
MTINVVINLKSRYRKHFISQKLKNIKTNFKSYHLFILFTLRTLKMIVLKWANRQ